MNIVGNFQYFILCGVKIYRTVYRLDSEVVQRSIYLSAKVQTFVRSYRLVPKTDKWGWLPSSLVLSTTNWAKIITRITYWGRTSNAYCVLTLRASMAAKLVLNEQKTYKRADCVTLQHFDTYYYLTGAKSNIRSKYIL